jgi:membrane fusion protein (multidrug efflux system)
VLGVIAGLVAIAGIVGYLVSLPKAEASQTEQQAAAEDQQESQTADATDEKDSKEKAPIPVEVAEITRGAISSYITASANLVPEDDVKVLAEAEGRIAELKVEEGDRVQAHQELAVLIRDEAEIAANKVRLKASNAELAFKRAEETLSDGLISREEFDRLKMEYEVARQEVAEAEWKLGKTSISAPFAGHVTERFARPGQHVRPGDELFSVADFEPLIARIYLPERDVLQLSRGREVRITLAADESISFSGRISQISPVVDTATGTVKVTVEVRQTPAQVRPGAFVNVGIVREQKSSVVLVPRESVIRELRSAHVFVREGDQAVKRPVQLGLEEGGMVEVVAGVEAGEQVIVAGQGGLKPGARIKTT